MALIIFLPQFLLRLPGTQLVLAPSVDVVKLREGFCYFIFFQILKSILKLQSGITSSAVRNLLYLKPEIDFSCISESIKH